MGLRTTALLAACLALPGCPAGSGGTATPPPPPAPAPAAAVEAAPAATAPVEPSRPDGAADLAAIGFAEAPPRPGAAATEANRRALEAHRRGRYDESRQGFAEAVRLEPTYDLARYNLACALSRSGEVDAARGELEPLLARDLPSFGSRLGEDPDLSALRAAPAGAALLERAASVRRLWEQALGQGVPAVLWREGLSDVGARVTDLARPGVYLPGARRFLPMAPAVPRGFAALVDPEGRAALVVAGHGAFSGIPQISGLSLQLFDVPAFSEVASFREPSDGFVTRADVLPVGGGLRFRAEVEPEVYRRWHLVSRGGGATRDPDQGPPRAPWLELAPEGAILSVPGPAGYEVVGNALSLPSGEPIALGPGHGASRSHSVLVSPDGRVAIVVSVRADCPDGEGVLHHFVDRVDLAARAVSRLSEGEGAAAARLGPDGALYLQVGSSLRRYADPASEASEAVPSGVLLTAPMSTPDCSA